MLAESLFILHYYYYCFTRRSSSHSIGGVWFLSHQCEAVMLHITDILLRWLSIYTRRKMTWQPFEELFDARAYDVFRYYFGGFHSNTLGETYGRQVDTSGYQHTQPFFPGLPTNSLLKRNARVYRHFITTSLVGDAIFAAVTYQPSAVILFVAIVSNIRIYDR